jgi:hypothetical protein
MGVGSPLVLAADFRPVLLIGGMLLKCAREEASQEDKNTRVVNDGVGGGGR